MHLYTNTKATKSAKQPHIASRPKKKPKKTYYLRKSKARKPYLNKEKHVRKFKPKKDVFKYYYLFACNEPRHLSSACPNRKNLYTREAALVGCTT